MSDRDNDSSPRIPRKSPSYPKLEAAGWDREDPTQILRNSLAKLEGAAAGGRAKLAEETADVRESTRSALRKCDSRRPPIVEVVVERRRARR